MGAEVIVTGNELPPEMIDAVREGRKVATIKLLRVTTGIGVMNAKEPVDRGTPMIVCHSVDKLLDPVIELPAKTMEATAAVAQVTSVARTFASNYRGISASGSGQIRLEGTPVLIHPLDTSWSDR